MSDLPDEQEVLRSLWLGPDWVPTSTACEWVGLRRQSFTASCVNRGVVRAQKDEDSASSLILRDDVWYVYTTRRTAVEQSQQVRYATLVEREVFPPSCRGFDGHRLTEWAKIHREDLLTSTLNPPAWMSRELPRGQTVSDFLSSEVLAQRMQRLENVLGSLLAANGIGATWTDFTDTDCQALLEQAHDCLQEPSPNLAHWNQVLSKLGVDHIAQVGAWSARNPKIVEAILGRPPSSPGYVLLLEVAKRNEALGRQLPGVTVRGSRNHMLYSAVQRTLTHTHQLVRLQLSSDLLMGPDQGQYLPAPLTCTDQFILSHLLS